MNLVILGATGMLGSMVLAQSYAMPWDSITACAGKPVAALDSWSREKGITWQYNDLSLMDRSELAELLRGATHVVNAAGTVKPRINEKDESSVANAIFINGLFPHRLASLAEEMEFRLVHVTTDCVFSGDIKKAPYVEQANPDARDVYGLSKLMGEVNSPQSLLLRTSIIGPEVRGFYSLLSWVLSQPDGSTVNGYTDQYWNGITTLHHAKIILNAIISPVWLPDGQSLHHVVPRNWLTKFDLVKTIAKSFGKYIQVRPVDSGNERDMRLNTKFKETNIGLWQMAGYSRPLSIEEMVDELAAYNWPWLS